MKRSSRNVLYTFFGLICFALMALASPASAQTLGAAQSFAVLGGNSVVFGAPSSTINGDVGISTAADTFITGYPANATITAPFVNQGNTAAAIAAGAATLTLFNSAELAPAGGTAITANLSTDGPTANGHYTPGKYSLASGTAIIPTSITLDGPGIYVFSLNSDITTSVSSTVILNGADACNVFWRVPTIATLNGLTFPGTVVAGAGVHLGSDASLTGRALTLAAGDVTMSAGGNTVGGCSAAGSGVPPGSRGMGSTKTCPPAPLTGGSTFQCTFTMVNLDTANPVTAFTVHDDIPDPLASSPCPGTVSSSTPVPCFLFNPATGLYDGIQVTTLNARGTAGDTCGGTLDETAPPCGGADCSFTDRVFGTGTDTGTIVNSDTGGSVTVLACTPSCNCPTTTGFPGLGGAGQFTVFAMNGPASGGSQKVTFSNDTINGDVGVAAGATVSNHAPSTVNGNVFVNSGGSFSGPGKVNGTIFLNQNLSGARTDAINASLAAAALAPNFTFTNVTSALTITGGSGLNVVDITGNVKLSNASLTLSGPPDAFFVVNIAGSVTLGGHGGIVVSGFAPTHLLINMTGSGKLLNTHVGNVIQGTLLGPNVGGTLDGAFGSLILGEDFTLMSGASVTFEGCFCPPLAQTLRRTNPPTKAEAVEPGMLPVRDVLGRDSRFFVADQWRRNDQALM
jgi:Ice-binding-like